MEKTLMIGPPVYLTPSLAPRRRGSSEARSALERVMHFSTLSPFSYAADEGGERR